MPRRQDKLLVFTPSSRQDAAGLRRARTNYATGDFSTMTAGSQRRSLAQGGERHGMSGISKSLNPRRNSDVFNESRAALCLLLASKRN